jgi:replicative DNA helicase
MQAEFRKQLEEGIAMAVMANAMLAVELIDVVSDVDFNDQFCGTILRLVADLEMAGQFSGQRLRAELKTRGYLEEHTELAAFITFGQSDVLDHTARYYAAQLANLAMTDKIRAAMTRALNELVQDLPDATAIAASLIGSLEGIRARESKSWESVPAVAERVYETYRNIFNGENSDRMGLPTGYPSLDEITGGLFPGQLWMIAARSYMGKSTVALAFASQQAERGNGVYFASYEMENEELMDRLYADKTGISLKKFTQQNLNREELDKVLVASQEFSNGFYCLDDRPPETVSGLKARVKLASTVSPIKLLVVDHLLMFPADKRIPRHEQLVEITREFKHLAKECDCTVMLLNQLNADAEGVEPNNKHFSQSKGILANLDVSILLHRESNFAEDMLFKITKNRKGAPGEVKMKFYGQVQRLEESGVTELDSYEPAFGSSDWESA